MQEKEENVGAARGHHEEAQGMAEGPGYLA